MAVTPPMLRMSRDPDRSRRTSPRSRQRNATARLLALTVLAAATSCTSAEQSMTAPSGSRCAPSLANSLDTSPAAGSSGTLSIGLSRDCAWAASSDATWVVITSATSGQGDGSIAYRVAANTEPAPRRTTIDVNNAKATINQAAECRYRVAPATADVAAAGETVNVQVQTEAACEWLAATDAAWIRLTGGAAGKGDGAITLAVAANSGATRSGTIRVAGHTVTVTQAAESCTYRITPTSETMSAAGGSVTVTVSAGGHCPWTTASSMPWITIAAGGSGTGAGSVQLNIATNSGAARTATATIAGQTLTVTQAPAPCTFTISPTTIDVPSAGGERTTNVTTRGDCAWTAASNVAWITVTAGSSATGSGTVRFNVAANVGDARNGALTIGGQTVTVTQEAAPCTFALSTASQRYDAAGGYGAVSVIARPACSWTAVSDNGDWLVITDAGAGTGNGVVNFSVLVNTGPLRVGTLTIGGQTFWVTQDP